MIEGPNLESFDTLLAALAKIPADEAAKRLEMMRRYRPAATRAWSVLRDFEDLMLDGTVESIQILSNSEIGRLLAESVRLMPDMTKAERSFMDARNSVSDDELVARMNSTPDNGGSLLVALSEFMERRSEPLRLIVLAWEALPMAKIISLTCSHESGRFRMGQELLVSNHRHPPVKTKIVKIEARGRGPDAPSEAQRTITVALPYELATIEVLKDGDVTLKSLSS